MRVKLSDLYDIGSSKRVFQSEWRKSGVPFYRAREIAKLSIDGYVDNELFIDEDLYLEYIDKYGKPEAGDVMVTGVGTLGVCYVVKQEDRFYFKDGNILWFKQKAKDRILPEYLVKAFDSKDVKEFIDKNSSGTTVGTFTIQTAKKMEISLPSIEEQRNIIQKITKIESVIKQRRQELQLLDDLIKARFVELFGDAIHNDKGWETDTVEKLCKEIYGGGTPSKSHPEYYEDGDIPWVSSKDMKTDVLTDSQIKINQLGVDNSTAHMVPINSVIMVIRSGILKHTLPVAINAVPITVNQDLKVFIPNERVLTRFLSVQFKMHEKDILSGVRAVTADNIEFNSLKQRELIVPPIELQQEYVTFLEQIDKSKVAVQKALDETQLLFDSLMQEYFG